MFSFQDTLAAKAVEEQQLGYDTDIKDSTPLLDRHAPSANRLELCNRCVHLTPHVLATHHTTRCQLLYVTLFRITCEHTLLPVLSHTQTQLAQRDVCQIDCML